MSKSETNVRGHAVLLIDEPDEIRYVIRRAVTDSGREIKFSENPEKAGVNNLLEIYELLSGQKRTEIETHFSGKGYGALKNEVAEIVVEALQPIRERYQIFLADPAELDRTLAEGAEKAKAIAEPKISEIKYKIGFVLSN